MSITAKIISSDPKPNKSLQLTLHVEISADDLRDNRDNPAWLGSEFTNALVEAMREWNEKRIARGG
jgi:hypothetical protein